ncbi:MAG: ATP-binding protein [Caulobacterales bacterium]
MPAHATAQSAATASFGDLERATIVRFLPLMVIERGAQPPFQPVWLDGQVEAITGFEATDFRADPGLLDRQIHADDADRILASLIGAAGGRAYACDYRWRRADGEWRIFQEDGLFQASEPARLFGVIRDVTQRRDQQRRQAQALKLEAVGQLTGGVAHDFNNLLTVILGNIDMLASRVEDEAKRRRRIEAMRLAAERGRALTGQLLAFGRRQQLKPALIEINALIAEAAPRLRRTVGEAVTLSFDLACEALTARLDAAQLETALVNLTTNARDAMPNGGRLTITSRDVSQAGGRWVEIEVADTGVGVAPGLEDHIFEPFFSTKEIGGGSGLGLCQVQGFVSQSGGEVRLDSAPGVGARFTLRLPACEDPAPARQSRAAPLPLGGSETVLVVEDDAAVLALTLDLMTAQGYRVLTASSAARGLELLAARPDVQLLFTDVVMPGGMNGVELARLARRLRPGMKVLLTSGFVGLAASLDASEFPLLDKPYAGDALAAALRKALDVETRRRERRGGEPDGPSAGDAHPG